MAPRPATPSLGRILLDDASQVRIQGEEIDVKARIEQCDLYSGHADASELVSWVKKRSPVRGSIFLTHAEESGLNGLRDRLSSALGFDRLILPLIDDAYELGPEAPRQIDINKPHRLKPEKVAQLDWRNDLSKLLIDITQEVNAAADERFRSTIIRRLRRWLEHQAE